MCSCNICYGVAITVTVLASVISDHKASGSIKRQTLIKTVSPTVSCGTTHTISVSLHDVYDVGKPEIPSVGSKYTKLSPSSFSEPKPLPLIVIVAPL